MLSPVHTVAVLYHPGSLRLGQCVCVHNVTHSKALLNVSFM